MRFAKVMMYLLIAVFAFSPVALAADAVKIGMITTLSTGGGYLGEDVRDGFLLAVSQEDGKLGGVAVEVLVEDDGRKPGNGKQIATRFLKSERVPIVTGLIFSNVASAVAPAVLKEGAFYISPNAGPSAFAGKMCDENYFVASWQNDSLHESVGEYARNLGYKKAFILAPNYPAGKDALTGFKRFFKGDILGEVYTKLGQSDFASELAQIRAANPEVVFIFQPGGMGINFLKQYAQGGFKDTIPLMTSNVGVDVKLLGAVGDAALGVHNTSHWSQDFDNEANKVFVKDFKAKYGRTPTMYASQGYDTAKLIASALKAVGGDMSNKDGFRAALKKADFQSVRGDFKFASNNHPIMNWYSRVVEKGADGKTYNKTIEQILTNHQDAYAGECSMK